MGRSLLALLVGFFITPAIGFGGEMLLGLARPEWFATGVVSAPVPLLILLCFSAVGIFLGCYATAFIEQRRPLRFALILGMIGLLISIPVNIQMWDTAPVWYHVVALTMVMPIAWLAGKTYLARHPAG